jgi:hypothetical protein
MSRYRWELASLRVRARKMVEEACDELTHIGFDVGPTESPIVTET